MDRPLVVGSASGLISSVVLTFLRGIQDQPLENLARGLECLPCLCEDPPPWGYFGAGIFVGLAVGPFLDLCWVVRQRWRRFIAEQLNWGFSPSPGSRPLYKVLAWVSEEAAWWRRDFCSRSVSCETRSVGSLPVLTSSRTRSLSSVCKERGGWRLGVSWGRISPLRSFLVVQIEVA